MVDPGNTGVVHDELDPWNVFDGGVLHEVEGLGRGSSSFGVSSCFSCVANMPQDDCQDVLHRFRCDLQGFQDLDGNIGVLGDVDMGEDSSRYKHVFGDCGEVVIDVRFVAGCDEKFKRFLQMREIGGIVDEVGVEKFSHELTPLKFSEFVGAEFVTFQVEKLWVGIASFV